MHATAVRRVLLVLTALVFIAIAIASLLAPHEMAKGLGYTLDSADARSEFRAIYVGLWLAHGLVCVVAARHIFEPRLGDVAGILVLGQVLGRLVSVVQDGELPTKLLPMALLETVGAIAILLVRPAAPARSDSP